MKKGKKKAKEAKPKKAKASAAPAPKPEKQADPWHWIQGLYGVDEDGNDVWHDIYCYHTYDVAKTMCRHLLTMDNQPSELDMYDDFRVKPLDEPPPDPRKAVYSLSAERNQAAVEAAIAKAAAKESKAAKNFNKKTKPHGPATRKGLNVS